VVLHPRAQGLGEGDEYSNYALLVEYGRLYLYRAFNAPDDAVPLEFSNVGGLKKLR